MSECHIVGNLMHWCNYFNTPIPKFQRLESKHNAYRVDSFPVNLSPACISSTKEGAVSCQRRPRLPIVCSECLAFTLSKKGLHQMAKSSWPSRVLGAQKNRLRETFFLETQQHMFWLKNKNHVPSSRRLLLEQENLLR